VHRPSPSGPGPAIARRGRGGPEAGDIRPRKRPRLRDRLWARITAALLAVFLIIVGWSVGHALTMPGGGSISERLAEWARGHYLGPVVTFGEWLTYQAPQKGGKPSFSLAAPSAAAAAKRLKDAQADKFAALYGPPATLHSLAGKPLKGEGVWRVLASVNGTPAIYGTYLRASSVYSSYVAGIASMNQRLLKFQLRPGTEDPGPGHWKASPEITPNTRRGLEATFNSGFKINVSGGGFYLNGASAGTLAKGAATVVYYKDGHVAIGAWGQGGLRMTSDVAGVRQNLRPIVVDGKIPASVDNNVTTSWGATLGGGYYVWRSGIGITRDGRVIFVYGPALNVRELAQLLKAAGVVTGMELDINPDWMSYEYYTPGHHPSNPTPKNLLPTQMQPANRYFFPASRDFTAVYAR